MMMRSRLGLLGISLFAFTACLDVTIVNTALPSLQQFFAIPVVELQWATNIFTMVVSMMLIAAGKLGDRLGRKRVLYVGALFFGVGAAGAGMSREFSLFLFFRALQAIGASGAFVLSAALIGDLFEGKRRLRAIAVYGVVTGAGLMLGPAIGGVLIALLSWRWVFWINLPLIGAGFLLCWPGLHRVHSPLSSAKIDWIGFALLVGGLGGVLHGVIGGAEREWRSVTAWATLGGGIALLTGLVLRDLYRKCLKSWFWTAGAFAAVQNQLLRHFRYKHPRPFLALSIFKHRLISLAALSSALAGVGSSVFIFFDTLYLAEVRGLSAWEIGLMVAILPAGQGLFSILFPWLVQKCGLRGLLRMSIGSGIASAVLHRLLMGAETPMWLLLVPFALIGATWGITGPSMIGAVHEELAAKESGEAVGTLSTVWNVVGALLLAATAALFHAAVEARGFLGALQRSMDGIIAFAALICLLTIWNEKRGETSS
jgi:MFS family permease